MALKNDILGGYGVLILEDVPENTEIGIDLKFWRVGKNFMGIKNIPLGIHYLYFSAVNSECQTGQRMGLFVNFDQTGFIKKKWCKNDEDFIDVSVSLLEQQRILSNYQEMAHFLGPYPDECLTAWNALTNMITPLTMEYLIPACGRIHSCTLFQSECSNSQQRIAATREQKPLPSPSGAGYSNDMEHLLPQLKVIPGTKVEFTPIPEKPVFPVNSSPEEITSYGLDQTYTLNSVLAVLQNQYELKTKVQETSTICQLSLPEHQLLAELQFSYLTLLLNHLMDGWYQWRRILKLLASCEQAIASRPNLYIALIKVLVAQLCTLGADLSSDSAQDPHSPSSELLDLFFTEATHHDPHGPFTEPSFLPTVLHQLLRNVIFVGDNHNIEDLVREAEHICKQIELRFHWGFDVNSLRREEFVQHVDSSASSPSSFGIPVADIDWDGEEAPQIVEL